MKSKRWLKKICVLSMIGCLLLTMLPVSFNAEDIEAGPKAGKVDEASIPADAIYISTTHDLIALAENCIDEAYSKGKVFVLNQDIYLSGVDFQGIPTFGGTFLGQGHKIYGLEFEQDKNAIGFFRYLQKDAVVNGLILQINIQPEGSNSMIGGIAGVNKGTIRNCIVNGVVSGKSMVGGLVGVNKVSGTIENCMMNGLVHGESIVGGFVGKNQGVIRECINNAEVNTAVEHNTIGMDLSNMDMDLEFSLDMDIDSLGFTEMMGVASDIGGIAGTSSGVIRACVNKGNVGYEKMGYNIGGIVGSQNGFLMDCVNYAEINGANGVGGIAGQMRPNIVINFEEMNTNISIDNIDDLEISDEDMQSIKDAVNELEKLENAEKEEPEEEESEEEESEEEESTEDIQLPENMEDIELPEDMEDIELPEDMEDFEDLESEEFDEDKFNAALNDLSNSLDNSLEDSDISLDTESGEMSDIFVSLGGMDMSIGIEIEDVSRDDTVEDTVGKAQGCMNYGDIYGSKYVGGIAGNANMESTIDMDEDIEINGELSISSEGKQRLVIRDCTNHGKVSVTKKYAGGIVGYMAIGAVIDAKNLGNLDCLNADYVGGIAGGCNTVIFDSICKCIIAGSDYVGGVAGWGYESYDNCAFVDITAGTKYVGSIFGGTEVLPDDRAESNEEEDNGPLVTGNTYYIVGNNIGGIDGINYTGASTRISLEEFLAMPNLNEVFKSVSIRFIVKGKDDVVLTVPTGGTLALDQLPVPEVKDGDIYEWVFEKPVTSKLLGMNEIEEVLYLSEARLTNVLFDQTYEADFNPKHMVAQGKDKTNDGKTRILAIGAFDTTTEVVLTNILATEKTVLGVAVSENWSVGISNMGVEELRYCIPADMNVEKITLYVKDANGNWEERDFTVIGSYMAFDFTDGEQGFALVESTGTGLVFTILIVASVILVAVAAIVNKKRKKQ
ncbi:MAG: hypothetical protein IJ455_09210 [Agathobacter sp.]|nr:hypothetical protein [Agathobacter sp.]